MNILIISDGDSKYGSANSLFGFVSMIKEKYANMNISIVFPAEYNMESKYRAIGCNTFKIPYYLYCRVSPFSKWKIPFSFIKHFPKYVYGRIISLWLLERTIRIETIDIIHSNSFREDLSISISKKYNIPLIMHLREFGDLDYASYTYRRGYITTMNKYVTKFIAVSDAVKDHWIKKGIISDKIIRIYNGVDINKNYKIHYPSKETLIYKLVIVGSVTKNKGHHVLVSALSQLPKEIKAKIKVDFIGDYNNKYGIILNRMIKEFKLSNTIRFLGYMNNPSRVLNEYDCGVMCSRCEAFGRVTIEYLMAGLCVIASKGGANPEIIQDNNTGFLFEQENPIELAKCIENIIKNPDSIKNCGVKGRMYAETLFSTEMCAEKIYNLYNDICG